MKIINRLNHITSKNKMIFRLLCFIMLICFILVAVIDIFANYTIPNYIKCIVFILIYIAAIFTALIGIESTFDRILQFIIIICSLLCSAGMFSEIIFSLFKNKYITQYFFISTFFIFSYLYEINFNNTSSHSEDYNQYIRIWRHSASIIGYTCNIIRIILLIFDVFNKQYNLWSGLSNLPISEAILTALAFEKIIKTKTKTKK